MRARFVLSEMAIGLRRNITLTVAVVVTVAISLTLFGVGWLLRDQVNAIKGYWYGKIEVSVYLCSKISTAPTCATGAVTQAERDAIRGQLQSLPVVQRVYYESPEQAYVHFKELFKNSPDLVRNASPAAMPESFRVKLKDPKEYAVVSSAIGSETGVESVQDERQILSHLFNVLNGFSRAVWIFALVLLAAAVLLIGNAIRVAAFSRRRETGIMRLVGASNFYIQLPFLLEGVFAGLLGGGLALLGLYLFYRLLINDVLRRSIPSINWIDAGPLWSHAPALVAAAVVLCALSAFVTLRRYLRV